MAGTVLSDLAAPLRDISLWNRLLLLPPDRDTGFITFASDMQALRGVVASGDPVSFDDPRLTALEDWTGEAVSILETDQVVARVARLTSDDEYLSEESGASQLMLALGLAVRKDAEAEANRFAPLMLCPVRVEGLPGTPTLRRIGIPVLNPVLRDHLGMDLTGLPEDSLTWTPEDLAGTGLLGVAPWAVLGLFDLPAYRLWERLDAGRDRSLETDANVRRLLGQIEGPWPEQARREATTPTLLSSKMDGLQAHLIGLSRLGVDMAIQGGPGTGKTHVVAHMVANALADGRSVLFLSGRSSAFRALLGRLKNTVFDAPLLRLFGAECEPQAVAARTGVEPAGTVLETLERASDRIGAVMATPATYAMHVPRTWSFDLLVVDEASLVTLAEALPAVAACRQVVVCGDIRQMQKDPPFWRLWDLEHPYVPPVTLLEAVVSARMPEAMLRHHYRSRHPALIHVTNWTYYDALMRVAPSPDTSGVSPYRVREVAGVFDWSTCENAVEVEAVVDELERHIASGSTASVGIITITLQQRDLIRRRIAERNLDLTAIEGSESLIVADYNGIQGQERDVILISMTLGPRARGEAWPTSYGAVSLLDGEKRMNVIMTRSRERMVMFTSFPALSVNAARAAGHMKLWIYMANGHGQSAQMPDDHDGVLSTVLKNVSWQAKDLGNAVGMFDPQTRRFAGAIFITGLRDPLTERSEIAQYQNSGWQVFELPSVDLKALVDDPKAQDALAHRLYQQFSSALIHRRVRS